MFERVEGWLTMEEVQPVLIFVAGIVAAFLVELIVCRSVLALTRRTSNKLDDAVAEVLRRPIFVSVLLVGASRSLSLVLRPTLYGVALAALQTVAVCVWTVAGFRISRAALDAYSVVARADSLVQPRTVPIFEMMSKIAIVGLAVHFMFLAWDIDVTAWLASAGIVGIAVGFAAKDSLANFFAGIFIIADGPYRVGDWIVLDTDLSLRGKVTNIGLRSTRILTRDDVEITIPNSIIGNSKIINEAGGPNIKQRVGVPVSCAYSSDIDQVRTVLLDCPKGVARVADEPVPIVRIRRFGASGLDFELLVWIVDPADRGLVIDELNINIYKAFAQAGIEIPYSKHDVYIKGMVARGLEPKP